MTASLAPETRSSSRRALLAGALAGVGAWAASAIGRANPVRAEGEAMAVGGDYLDATSTTTLANNANNNIVFHAQSNGSGIGVFAVSTSGDGLYADGFNGYGAVGNSEGAGKAGVIGHAYANNTGVLGFSDNSGFGSSARPTGKAKTGVYGYANQDSNAKGIFGESANGYAGYFAGKVYTTKFYEMTEITAPAAPAANRARLFVRDVSGSTQLCVKFANGKLKTIATDL